MEARKIEKEFWRFLKSFKNPCQIQNYIDTLKYNPQDGYRPPIVVWETGKAHCAEGALIASGMLMFSGYKPFIIDMKSCTDMIQDHEISVYKLNGYWGSVAKSNTTVLRGRDPVYKSIREIVMSYYPFYVNLHGRNILREYSSPINICSFLEKHNWMTTRKELIDIENVLISKKHHKILTPSMIKRQNTANPLLVKAVYLGANPKGLLHTDK